MSSSQNNSTESKPRRKKETPSFLHDANARNDQKILRLRAKGGWEYYGLYFACVEVMREHAELRIDREAIEAVAFSLHVEAMKFEAFLDTCVSIGLFVEDSSGFYSSSLNARMERYKASIDQRSEAGKQSAKARKERTKPTTVPTRVERPFNDRSTAVTDTVNGPNINRTRIELEPELELNSNQNQKPKQTRAAPKYREFTDTDFAFPPKWGQQATAALESWISYKAKAGHPCLLESYHQQVKQFADKPRLFAELVARAIRNGWRGLNEQVPLEAQAKGAIAANGFSAAHNHNLELIRRAEEEENDQA